MSLVIERANRVMALSFNSESDGVGSPIILEAIRVILKSLFLLGIGSRGEREKVRHRVK